jgi:hypothetical protein
MSTRADLKLTPNDHMRRPNPIDKSRGFFYRRCGKFELSGGTDMCSGPLNDKRPSRRRAKEMTAEHESDHFTFEQRPLSELPDSDLSQWLADFHGDDQWQVADDRVTQAVVVQGHHIIIWQDAPLTDEDKKDAVAEYEHTIRDGYSVDESEVAS